MTQRPAKVKKKMGRPTIFTPELAELICELTATHTYGLAKLCDMYDELQDKHTVNQWRYKYTDFSTQYAKAKLVQAELLAEEILDIAYDGRNDWMESLDNDGNSLGWKINGEHVQRSKLRIDTHKWLASKLIPRTYGTMAEETKSVGDSLVEKLIDKIK